MKLVLIVLDSVGIGSAPDAAAYGDEGAATLPHIAETVGGLKVPTLQALGLGNIPSLLPATSNQKPATIRGVSAVEDPLASFGAMQELSQGKDTITGHWELAGLQMDPGFHLFPPNVPSFPDAITGPFVKRTGRGILGNKAASGTAVIDELGPEHMESGKWIVYTSGDSVFQIAANIDLVPLDELYRACEVARELCNPYRVGRVIARPFRGKPGGFHRTEDRRDYAYKPTEPTILERVKDAGIPAYAVGKIDDIFAHRGITKSNHTGNNRDSQKAVEAFTREPGKGFIFANFIDFDMLYGHRRDPKGYAACIEQTDAWLKGYLPQLGAGDVLVITADHGNDPTFKGTDHTREVVPLLVYRPGKPGQSLGLRRGFFDVAQSTASYFGLPVLPRGVSFI
jgi:phosphopentomutase